MKRTFLLLTASLALAATPTWSAVLTLDYSGTFGPTSTLNGTPFGVDTPFFIQAAFDPDANIFPLAYPGVGLFSVTAFTIQLPSGTYTASPAPNLNVELLDPSSPAGSFYAVGLGSLGEGFASGFSTATPLFSAAAPTPSFLSDYLPLASSLPYTITLDGVAGDLVINDIGASAFGAELTGTSAAPEPSQWAMMGVTLLGAGGFFVRHRRSRR